MEKSKIKKSPKKVGQKVRLFIQVGKFDSELKTGEIDSIIKSDHKPDMYVVNVDGQMHYRWLHELKTV